MPHHRRVRVPFRILTDDEEKFVSRNYESIEKQVKDNICAEEVSRGTARVIVAPSFVLLVLAVVIPGFVPMCGCGSPEYRAITILRAINSSQSLFSSSCGGDGYAQSPEDLAKAPAGRTAGFISGDISRNGVTSDGYVFTVTAGVEANTVTTASKTCNGA